MERTRAQIRRLEEMVGTPLLRRRREGLVFTKAANVLARFEFTGPPFRHSLAMALAFAATGDRPTALLTVPNVIAGIRPGLVPVSTLSPA